MKKDLKDLNEAELKEELKKYGQRPYRAVQVLNWLYSSRAGCIADMKNLPLLTRKELEKKFTASSLTAEKKQESKDKTMKLLFALRDGFKIESVIIQEGQRATLCVSSQAGCACGCEFCATGAMGFKRNLLPGEITEQFLAAQKTAKRRITNVVFMGMGEPFNNYENVEKAVTIMSSEKALKFSQSRITISTIGVVPGIRKLAESGLKVKLAVSVVSADPVKRGKLVPYEKKYPLKKIVKAVKYYNGKKGSKVTVEYVMIENFNDSEKDARKLVDVFAGCLYRVNLIPFNDTGEECYGRAESKKVLAFQKILRNSGVEAFIRKEKGADISAACGQLAAGEAPGIRAGRKKP